jgi:hypothetical protein
VVRLSAGTDRNVTTISTAHVVVVQRNHSRIVRLITLRKTELRAIRFGTIIPSLASQCEEDFTEMRNGPERNTESADFSTRSNSVALDSRLVFPKLCRRGASRTFKS